MAVAHIRRFRRVGFGEDQMPNDAESGRFSFDHKAVNAVPAVEADHQRIVLKDAVHLTSAGLQPFVGDVTGKRASLTVMQTNQIWRIGQNKIDSIIGHASHELNAITQEKTGHERYSSGYRGRQETGQADRGILHRGEDMPRKQLEGRSSEKGEAWCILAPGSGYLRAERGGGGGGGGATSFTEDVEYTFGVTIIRRALGDEPRTIF